MPTTRHPGIRRPRHRGRPAAVPGLGWGIVAASILVIVSAFLVWATFKAGGFTFSVKGIGGTDGPDEDVHDGAVTLTLAIAALVLGLIRAARKAALGAAIVALVMGAIIALVALADIGSVGDAKDDLTAAGVVGDVSVGAGLWLTLVGGLVLVVLGIVGIVKRR